VVLGKIRINPGNIGFGNKRDEKFERVIEYAITHDIPVRIGVNWGSLDKYLLQKLMDENSLSSNPKSCDVVLRQALAMSAPSSAMSVFQADARLKVGVLRLGTLKDNFKGSFINDVHAQK
jgi:4-hydroxy-3-methylbut-2-en-1-yl diphosphate synthase IspG/GcpE